MKLEGKRALITGGSGGFGLAVAKAFHREGADLVLVARNKFKLVAARKELAKMPDATAGQEISIVPYDVVDEDLMYRAIELDPFFDIFVSCAGVYGPKGNFENNDLSDWVDALNINLLGTILPCTFLLPIFKKQNYGRIILASGGGATKPMPYLSAYAASKAAVVRFGETLALEVKDYDISVNCVAPGALNTKMLDEILKAGPERVGIDFYTKSVKQKESGGDSLENAAELCVQLASKEGGQVTGKLISAVWDNWRNWEEFVRQSADPDRYTLRRNIL